MVFSSCLGFGFGFLLFQLNPAYPGVNRFSSLCLAVGEGIEPPRRFLAGLRFPSEDVKNSGRSRSRTESTLSRRPHFSKVACYRPIHLPKNVTMSEILYEVLRDNLGIQVSSWSDRASLLLIARQCDVRLVYHTPNTHTTHKRCLFQR